MEAKEVIATLERLANGQDVESGEALPPESQYQKPQAIRALYEAIRMLEASKPKTAEPVSQAGKPWTPEEEGHLVEAFDTGSSIKDLAEAHQRTKGAIRSRLVKLGKIEAD